MALKRTRVNGELYDVGVINAADIRPGVLVCCKHARKAYRIVTEDRGEMILRNLRHPDMLDVATSEWIYANCYLLEPCG